MSDVVPNERSAARPDAAGLAMLDLGRAEFTRGDYYEALRCYRSALTMAEKGNDPWLAALACDSLGEVASMSGDYIPAIEHYHRALALQEELRDTAGAGRSLHAIGVIYGQFGDLDTAHDYLQRALDAFEAVGDVQYTVRTLANLGAVHSRRNELDLALNCGLRALHAFQMLGDAHGMAATLIQIGEIYKQRGNADVALVHQKRAVALLRDEEPSELLVHAIVNIGRLYAESDDRTDLEDARFMLEQALELAETEDLGSVAYRIHEELAGIIETLGDHRGALKHYRDYVRLMGVHSGQEKQKAIAELRLRFDLERALKDEEIRRRDDVMQAVVQTQEREQRRIAADLHDGVGQSLASAKLHLQLLDATRAGLTSGDLEAIRRAATLLDRAYSEVRVIAHNLASSTLQELGLPAAMHELVAGMRSEHGPRFDVRLHGIDEGIPEYVALVIYRIAQELLANVLKHARASTVTVELIRRDDSIVLMVEDDGVGFDMAANPTGGMGRRSIETRARTANGTVTFDTRPGRGTTVTVEIPSTS